MFRGYRLQGVPGLRVCSHAPSPTGYVLGPHEGGPVVARRPIPELTNVVQTRAPHGAIALQHQAVVTAGCDGLDI